MRPTNVTRVEATLDALSCLPNALPLSRGRRPSAGAACQAAPSLTACRRYRRIDFPLGVAVTDMQHEKALQVVLVEVRVQHEEERHVVWTFVGMPRRHHVRRIGRLVGCHKQP